MSNEQTPLETTALPAIEDDPDFRYAAFISYRHVEPDRQWAKWLHLTLETYRVPKRLVRDRGLPERIGRCFRDEEELSASDDLSRDIEQALRESRFLIVVCSPRIVESRWCNREVERFRELGRGGRILALLVEGEPHDSFPPALVEIRRTVTDGAGITREQIEAVEPLAADVRPAGHDSIGHARRMAKLRLLAQILGVRFDDLRQREQDRRTRRLAVITSTSVLLMALTSGLAVLAFLSRSEAVRQRGIAQANAHEATLSAAEAERQTGIAQENERKAVTQLARSDEEQGRRELLARNNDVAAVYLSAAYKLDPASLSLRFLMHQALAVTSGTTRVFRAHRAVVLDARFTSDASRVLTFGDDRAVNIWNAQTGTRLATGSGLFTHIGYAPVSLTSADGKWAVLQAENSYTNLDVYDTGSLKKVGMIAAARDINKWAYSEDGTRLFVMHSASLPGSFGPNYPKAAVTAWTLPEGKLVQQIAIGGDDTHDLIPSADGRWLAVGDIGVGYSGIELWDVDHNSLVKRFSPTLFSAAAFSLDGALFAYSDQESRSQSVKFVSTANGDEKTSWDLGDVTVTRLIFSSDNKTLAAALERGATVVRLRNLATGTTRDLVGNIGGVVDAEFSRDGQLLVSCDATQVIVFDVASGKVLAKTSPHEDKNSFCHFSPDGQDIVTGGVDRTARLWRCHDAAGVERWAVKQYRESLSVSFAPNGNRVVIAGDESPDMNTKADHFVRVLDAATGEEIIKLGPLAEPVGNAVFLPDGKTIATMTAPAILRKDFLIRLWNVDSGKVKRSFQGFLGAVSPDGKLVAGTNFNQFTLYATDTGDRLALAALHQEQIERIAFSRNGRWIVTSSRDMPVVLWDVIDPKMPAPLVAPGHASALNDLDFSTDDRLLLTGSADGSARVWDLSSANVAKGTPPQLLQTLIGHEGAVSAVRLSADGAHAVTGGLDGVTIEWNARTGEREWTLEPPPDESLKTAFGEHLQAITVVRLSADGQFIATGSVDGFVRVWDAHTGQLLLARRAYERDTITDLDWNPKDGSLLVGALSGVRLLDVSYESLPPNQVADLVNLRSSVRLTDSGIERKPEPRPIILRAEDPVRP